MLIANLTERIKNAAARLTESERALASYFLANPTQVAFWPASKFARTVGVSEATVVRFARSLDYDTYGALQKDVQQQVEDQLRGTIPGRFEESRKGYGDHPLTHVLEQDMQNLRATVDFLDREEFDRAAELLAQTEQLLVVGLRASEPIAAFASYAFSYLVPEVITLTRSSDTFFEQLMRLRPGACVIAVAFARNALRTVQIAEAAKERGAKLIVFTDTPLAPIASLADVLLLIRTDSPSFIQSLTAVFSVVNGLVLTTSAQRGEEAASRLAEIEGLLRRFDVVLFPNGRGAK